MIKCQWNRKTNTHVTRFCPPTDFAAAFSEQRWSFPVENETRLFCLGVPLQREPYQSERISLVWTKFPVTFSESITVMNTEKVSRRLLCRAEVFLRVSWWGLIQILQEGTRWWEKANLSWTCGQICAGKFTWFQPQASFEGICPFVKHNRSDEWMNEWKV